MEGRSVRRVARAKIKQPRRGFTAFFEVGVAELFLEIESEREAHSTRIPRHSHVVVVIPMAAKDCFARGWASQ
jgi:hypothetical protein